MSTLRYSGQIRIRVTYLEPYCAGDACPPGRSTNPNGEYRCFLRGPDRQCETIHVGAPASLSHGVDSPEAFDEAASAAISFADPGGYGDHGVTHWGEYAATMADGSGVYIGRSPAKRWPESKLAKAMQVRS